ncbi:MAG: hypothetical protein V7L12_29150 [Nostoc sp.]
MVLDNAYLISPDVYGFHQFAPNRRISGKPEKIFPNLSILQPENLTA